ncbi:peptidylprolyl isomerase [Candidatus Woesearchaeota archaeon]|nr:peptidylprolyl isomerase [Candidatus Woesearchaeota archaeon]MBT6044976.1 peptidylprolyl isomerase [Candidatus Woesearchaeota archaeon]
MIEKGSKIKLHYKGTLEDGTVFDSSEGKDPLEFEVGAGAVIAGFDEGVIGMKKGEKKTINIPADKAYGQYDEKRMGEYPKANVPKDMELKVGAKMFLQSPDGGVALATIKEIKDDVVVLDLNHPLAGKNLTFEVEIIEVN